MVLAKQWIIVAFVCLILIPFFLFEKFAPVPSTATRTERLHLTQWFDWNSNGTESDVIEMNPIKAAVQLRDAAAAPRPGKHIPFRGVQETPDSKTKNEQPSRRQAIVDAMYHSWQGYRKQCFGRDQLKPLSGSCHDWFNLGATLIDSLDTLWLMGMTSDFNSAKKWLQSNFNPNSNADLPFFEVVIRIVGGLLAAFDLSNDDFFLDKAAQLADAMMPAFNTQTGIPMSQINPRTGQSKLFTWANSAILAEVGTIQLEYRYLSHHTRNPTYWDKAKGVITAVQSRRPTRYPGLLPIFINPQTGHFNNDRYTFGAMGDSYYEYLLKVWLLSGKTDDYFRNLYLESANEMLRVLLMEQGGYKFVGEMNGGHSVARMEHLTCFVPGMLALGVMTGATTDATMAEAHLTAAKDLTYTCVQMYLTSPSGLAGEFCEFNQAGIRIASRSYQQRPEVLESVFYLWRATKNETYRDWGWQIFQGIQKCKAPYGYSGAEFHSSGNVDKTDVMESFFLAETLKYLYLLFSDDSVVQLDGPDAVVFNTEAHPLSVLQ